MSFRMERNTHGAIHEQQVSEFACAELGHTQGKLPSSTASHSAAAQCHDSAQALKQVVAVDQVKARGMLYVYI